MSAKKSHVLQQTCSIQMQVCLSLCDPFIDTKRLKVNCKHNSCIQNPIKDIHWNILQKQVTALPGNYFRKTVFSIYCSLRGKCPYLEFFWSAFSRSRTECGGIRSPNAGKYGPKKNSEYEQKAPS